MKTSKKTKKPKTEFNVIASKDLVLPVYYNGSIIYIDDKEPKLLKISELKYEPLAQIEEAILKGQLIEVEAG